MWSRGAIGRRSFTRHADASAVGCALLPEAFLIDPPDQAERVQALETDRDAARAATASGDLDGYPSRNFDALCINPTVLF